MANLGLMASQLAKERQQRMQGKQAQRAPPPRSM